MPLKHTQPDFDFNTPFVWEDFLQNKADEETVPFYPDPAKHDRERNPTETPAGFQLPSMDDILGPTRPDIDGQDHEAPETPEAAVEGPETPEGPEATPIDHEAPEAPQAAPSDHDSPEPPQLDPHEDTQAPVHPQVEHEQQAPNFNNYQIPDDDTQQPEDTEADDQETSGPDDSPQVPDDVDQQPPEQEQSYLPPASQPEDYLVDHPPSDNLFDSPMAPGETRTFQAYWM